jgi:hypothetical protein
VDVFAADGGVILISKHHYLTSIMVECEMPVSVAEMHYCALFSSLTGMALLGSVILFEAVYD